MQLAHKSLACPISTKYTNDFSCSKIKNATQARGPQREVRNYCTWPKYATDLKALREDCNFVVFLQVSDALNPDIKTFILNP